MLKRTLWYACLVLLCCGISVLVVMATSATKTTLVPTDATSTASRAAVGGLFSASAPVTGTPVAKPQQPPSEQVRLRSDVPPPSTHLDVPEVVAVEKAPQEARDGLPETKAAEEIKAAQETKAEVQGEPAERERIEAREVAPPERDAQVNGTLRKELELQARGMGYDPDLISALSDADLRAVVARGARRTSEVQSSSPEAEKAALDELRLEEQAKLAEAVVAGAPDARKAVLEELKPEEQAKLAEEARGPVALTEPVEKTVISGENGGYAPVFGSAGEPAGETLGGQEAEKVAAPPAKTASDAYTALMANEPLTEPEKELALSYMDEHPEVVSDQGDRDRESLDNYGGPDSYGYRFYDSVSPDTATYSWIELRGDGGTTWCSSYSSADDGYSRKYGFGFSFPFYGVNQDSFRVVTNGYIIFTTTESSLSNGALPSTSVTGPAIFPFWDDLHLLRYKLDSLVIGFKNFGTYTVIEFDSIGFYNSSCYPPNANAPLSFEVICFTNGNIKIQYREITTPGACQNSQTVGIQSAGAAGSAALQYANNGAGYPPVNGRAVWFKRVLLTHDYADSTITSPSGTQPVNTAVNVTARFKNWGTTTEPCSVRYQFNGGAIVSGRTDTLAQNAGQTYTFPTQITTPGTVGSYPLWVWSDLALDEERRNDTIKTNVMVNGTGVNCANVFTIPTAGPDSTTLNNCGAGDSDPNQPCGASGADMVFAMRVSDGQQGEFWQSSAVNVIDSRTTLRWGGACPGSNTINCLDDPDETLMRFVNHLGVDTTIYFTLGNYYIGGTCGNFMLGWKRMATTAYNVPFASGFEVTPYPTSTVFPNFWSTENSNNDAYVWNNYSSGAYSGTYCAYKSYSSTAGNDDWLFSPGLNLTSGNTYYVEYWRKAYSGSYPESLEVKVGTANTSAAMLTSVVPWDSFKTTTWVKKYGVFTAGATLPHYIGFHSYTRNSSGGCYLDSLRVVQMLSNNFRTLSVTSPSGLQAPSSVANVTATFQNFGGTAQPCSVRYQFNSGTIVSEETPSLASLGTDPHTFTTTITMPGTPGTYPLVVWTDLAADQDRSNDTIRLNVDVNYDGWTCATARPITTAGPDSLTLNNTGAGNNTPGQMCQTTAYNDMVFTMSVPNDQQGEFWITSGLSNYHSLKWGGTCPGTTLIACVSSSFQKLRYVNHTGSAQDMFFVVAGSSTTPANFKLAWQRQAAAVYTPPYSNSFEITVVQPTNPTYHTLPDFWSIENSNADGPAYTWENYNSGALSGTYCARMYKSVLGGNDDWLFTPGLILNNTTTYYLDYWRKAYSATYPESLEVKIGTQNASSAMTTTLMPFDTNKTVAWVQKGTAFTVSTPDTYYIGFHDYTRSYYGGYLDSVRVLAGACGAPGVTVNSATGTTFATLTATASGGWGGPIQYQWFTGISCADGNRIAGANLSTYLATASGDYSVRAWRADSVTCSACDSAQVTLSSPCTAIVPPYSESFDTTAGMWATCWSQVNANGDATLWTPSASTPLSSPNCMYIGGTVNGNDDWLFSEPLSLEADTTYVLEYWRRSANATYYDSIEVKYGGARLPAAMTNTLIAADTSKTTAYVLKAALFIPTVTGTYHIGFHSMSKSTSAGTRMDSVRVIKGICGAPTVTVNSALGTNFATLTAVATGGYGGALQYQWFTGDSCQDGNRISYATGSTYLATASGIYSVRAWRRDSVTCSACDSAEVTLSATCVAVVPEYIENFDTTAGLWSDCWSQENRNVDATAWAPSSSTPYSGTNCMYIAGTAAGNDDWLYSEPVTLSSDTAYVLEYWRYSTSSTYYDSLRVMYGTQRLAGAMLNTIFPPDTGKTTAYRQKFATFTPPTTATYYMGFHSRSNSASAGTRVDSLHLYAFGPCAAPTVTVNSVIGTYTGTLTANVSGGHGGPFYYQWYTGDLCQTGNEIAGQTNPTYVASVPGIYSCRAGRGPVDSTQCTACDSGEVTLPCLTATVPTYFQGFETAVPAALPTCWTQENTNADAYTWGTYTGSAHSGAISARIQYNTAAAMNDWLFSSKLQLSSDTTYYLEYWYNVTSTSYRESLEVKLGTLPSSASMTQTLRAGFGFATSTYTRDVVSFTPPSTGTYHIGWHGCSIANQYYIYLDDIRVWAAGACAPPDSVRVPAMAGLDSVTLTATVYGGWGAVPSYQWYTGIGCVAGNEIAGATALTYKTYVPGNFSFRVYFADSNTCAGCDSAYAGVVVCSIPQALPVFEGFESTTGTALPLCWTQVDVDGDGRPWQSYTYYPHTGLRNAYNLYSTGVPTDDWMFTRGVGLTGGDTLVAEYWYRCYSPSASYFESLELRAGLAANVVSMTSIVDTNFVFSNVSTYIQRSRLWVVPSTGTYFFGWHAGYLIDQGGICVDDIAIYELGGCSAPDSVKVNSPTGSDSTTLRCTVYGGLGGPPVYQWYTGAGCVNANRINGATLDSLRVYSSGTYSCRAYRVDSVNCAGCASGTGTVINCTAGATPPYQENFDGVTAPALPACWSEVDANGDGYYWHTYNAGTGAHSSPNTAYINYNGSLSHNDWLFTPKLNLTADTTYRIDYWYRNTNVPGSYPPDSLEFRAGRAATPDSMTIVIRGPLLVDTTVWREDVIAFTPTSSGQYVIGFHAVTRPNAWNILIDDFMVYTAGTCSPPTSVTANDVTGYTYASLSAAYTGGCCGPPAYQWYTDGTCQSGNEISGATTATYTATASGLYSVQVSFGTGCTGCDSARATVNADTCLPVAITPFSERFDGVTTPNLPFCWKQQNVNNDSYQWTTSSTFYASSPYSVYIYYSSTGNNDWLYTPPMILTNGLTYRVSYMRRVYYNYAEDSLEIKFGTVPVGAYMTNVITTPDTCKSTAFVTRTATFTPSATDTYYVGFHSLNKISSSYTYLDNIMLFLDGSCGAPDSVRANDVSGYVYAQMTANVYGGYGSGPAYQWYNGGTCQGGNEISGATTSNYYTTSSGTFSAKVSFGTGCTACDSAMATVNPDTCLPVSITPFSEGFESTTGSALPYCWRYWNGGYSGYYWQTTTTSPHAGLRDVYMYGYGPTYVADDWMYTAPMILTNGVSYTLGYWRRNYSSTYGPDSLEIKYGTVPFSTFMTGTVAPFNTNTSGTWVYKESSFTPAVADTYYIGFHCQTERTTTSSYTYVDDIALWPTGTCAAPTVTVNDCTVTTGAATLTAVLTGGYGGTPVYQWYRGYQCLADSAIGGANGSVYVACVSGIFACRVYMADSTACMGCDSGIATIGSTAPLGYDCCSPIYVTGSDSSVVNNCGMGDTSPGQSCGGSGNDMVFGLVVPVGYTGRMHKTTTLSVGIDSRTSLMVNCGDLASTIGCIDDPDTTWWSYTNCTGATDTVYFVIGNYYVGGTCGTFTVAWQITPGNVCPDISCTPTVTESGGNNGCGNDNLHNTITCGDVVSGSVTATTTLRDVDAFEMTITEAKNITVSLQAEFNVALQVRTDTVGTLCPDVYLDAMDNVVCGTESRTFYNVPAGLVHLIVYPPFIESCGSRDYCMTVTCAAGTVPPGEDCSNPIVLTPPGSGSFTRVTGNNQGYAADYPDSCEYPGTAADVMYSLTISSCRRLTFSLDTSGTMVGNDKFIEVFESGRCGGDAFLCNDDAENYDTLVWEGIGQRPGYVWGSFCGGELPAGTYYIRVSNASTGPGPYKLTVYDNGACACDITCQGGDALETTESRYDTTFYRTDPDGGCLITPPAFGAINCGATLCGVGFNYQRKNFANYLNRDTDWYLFTIATRRVVTLTVNAEFPAIIGVVDTNGCLTPVALFGDSAVPACTPTAVSDTLDPGTYSVAIAPRYFVGNPLPSTYRATLSCICIPGRKPTDVTCRFDSADGTPIGTNYWNDIRIRWTADSAMAGVGTYTIYWNLNDNLFPGGTGWAVLTSGITPVLGPRATSYADLNVVNATILRRFYVVVAVCE